MAQVSSFKQRLMTGNYGLDDLLQIYQIYAEFDGRFIGGNPFWEHKQIVSEVLAERFPDAGGQL